MGLSKSGIRGYAGQLRRALAIYMDGLRDAGRHIRHGGLYEDRILENMTSRQMERQLTKDYHRIEKGLALPSPKRPFGDRPAERIAALLEIAPPGDQPTDYARTALSALSMWSEQGAIDEGIAPRRSSRADAAHGGHPPFSDVMLGRRSVRNFLPAAPSIDLVRSAVAMACTTPSVCNRQAWFAHYYSGDEAQKVLKLQNGNAGFRQTIPAVFIITADSRLYSGLGERNQRWIDGGMFAMSLALCIESLGMSSCFLNWSMSNDQSNELRRSASISDEEDIVTFLAIGFSADDVRVARSPRRPTDEVLQEHGGVS